VQRCVVRQRGIAYVRSSTEMNIVAVVADLPVRCLAL
jgi:hypothetical protein